MSFFLLRPGKLPIFSALLAFSVLSSIAFAQGIPAQASRQKPQYEMAGRTPPSADRAKQILSQRNPNEHPLMPCLRWAYDGLDGIQRIQDYSATLVKRERINGELLDHEFMFVKVRHNPFSVYMTFLKPDKKKGQEVMYTSGEGGGKMQAHGVGIQALVGTLTLDPTGQIAMTDNRYPITEIGMLTLVKRLIEVGETDSKYGECEVQYLPGAKVGDRVCTCILVVHPVPRRNFRFNVARIFVDDELNVPIRYEAYDWPETEGGKPRLLEEYTYMNLKLNNGFTDADFDVRNPNYNFRVK